MIELYIDGRRVEITPEASLVLSASVEQLTDPESITEKKYEFLAPMMPENRTALGFPEQMLSPRMFNQTVHTAEIRYKKTPLLKGTVKLNRCETKENGSGTYELSLIVSPPEWISIAAGKTLAECPIDFNNEVNENTIQQSWNNNSTVKFLPVKRDRYPEEGENSAKLEDFGWQDYHPFVHTKTLMDAIAGKAGYRIASKFLNDPFFQSLHISGNYNENGNTEAVRLMDFQAIRTAKNKTIAFNSDGKAFASEPQSTHSVGNLVDTAKAYPGNKWDPEEVGFGKCFKMIDGRPAFVPQQDTVVGFEFQMKYESILSAAYGQDPKGFIQIQWEGQKLYEPIPKTPIIDRKNKGGSAGTYVVARNIKKGDPERIMVYNGGTFIKEYAITEIMCVIEIPVEFTTAVFISYINSQNTVFTEWALYSEKEYNDINGKTEKEITVRSVPKFQKKGVPVFFDTVVFEGGMAGSAFTLHAGASIRPVFYSAQSTENTLNFAGICHHDVSQLKFMQAVAHLFELHFYTDESTKTIYIEPRSSFLDETNTIDWTNKIESGKPYRIEEMGNDHSRMETYIYRSGDAAVSRRENAELKPYGAWTGRIENHFAENKEKKYENPLFTATLDEKNTMPCAADASFVVAGNRVDKQKSLNFPLKIVRYLGMKTLPQGQAWRWPSYAQEYPLAVFHSADGGGLTLRFDDADGQMGLKCYYQPKYDRINKGKKLTLYLRLTPSDMEAIIHPNSTNRDFRGNFTFHIRGEKIRGRLIEVSGYNPGKNGSTRCVFAVEL